MVPVAMVPLTMVPVTMVLEAYAMKLQNPFILLVGAALGSPLAPRLDLAIINSLSALLKPVRAWAAAEAADGDLDHWHASLGIDADARHFGDRALLRRMLRATARAGVHHMIWESTLFNSEALPDPATAAAWAPELAALEKTRKRAQRSLHGLKPLFLPFSGAAFPAIGGPPASLEEAAAALAAMPERPRLPADPALDDVQRSLAIASSQTLTYWLRWQTVTAAGDVETAYARVIEPLPKGVDLKVAFGAQPDPIAPDPGTLAAEALADSDLADIAAEEESLAAADAADDETPTGALAASALPIAELPSIVICHGLGVEYETSGPSIAFARSVARRGLRVVLPEAPGHGRRRSKGLYGGESFLRGQPISGVTHLLQASAEAARLVAWCRANGSATVALAGSSLGAMTAQLAAARAAESGWTAASPDHLLLVTPTGNLSTLAFTSSLSVAAGLDRMVQEAGWTPETFARWSSLVEPPARPPIDPAAISMVLGTDDTVTPYEDGLALAQGWQVPEKNLVIAGRGHFTSSIAMALPGSALDKLAQALAAAA
jgi:pimeloyl-ACP methyl ester carboxylesterase